MKEYDEDQAVQAMIEAAGLTNDDDTYNAVCQVLDLIYDFYEENGSLEISFDEDDEQEDVEAIVAYVNRQLKKSGDASFTEEQLSAMVVAEIEYEEECA